MEIELIHILLKSSDDLLSIATAIKRRRNKPCIRVIEGLLVNQNTNFEDLTDIIVVI